MIPARFIRYYAVNGDIFNRDDEVQIITNLASKLTNILFHSFV